MKKKCEENRNVRSSLNVFLVSTIVCTYFSQTPTHGQLVSSTQILGRSVLLNINKNRISPAKWPSPRQPNEGKPNTEKRKSPLKAKRINHPRSSRIIIIIERLIDDFHHIIPSVKFARILPFGRFVLFFWFFHSSPFLNTETIFTVSTH